MEKSAVCQRRMVDHLSISGSRDAAGERQGRLVPQSWPLRSSFMAIALGGRPDLWKMRPGKATGSAIIKAIRRYPSNVGLIFSVSSLVYHRHADRSGQTILDFGQMASRPV